MLRPVAALALTAAAVVGLAGPVAADPAPPPGYLAAVEEAYGLIAHASGADRGPADRAIRDDGGHDEWHSVSLFRDSGLGIRDS